MPPTTPRSGIPTFAVVMARLMSQGRDLGIRPFLVQLGNGEKMSPGIQSKCVP